MASDPEITSFASQEAMASSVATLIAAKIEERTAGGNVAELAVSGGSTPLALYRELAGMDLNWPNTRLTLVDERWVPPHHPRSNEAFVREAFNKAPNASVQGLFLEKSTINAAVSHFNSSLEPSMSGFDVVVLGMGNDGHTASWFPHAAGLGNALTSDDRYCAITAQQSDVTGEEVERVSLTLSAIKQSPLIVLLLAGEAKYETLQVALEPGSVVDMPVRAILSARPDMHICYAP